MSLDWETHRITTRAGYLRALVFTLAHSVVLREPLGYYAARVTTFDSMKTLKRLARKKGWRVEVVRHFS